MITIISRCLSLPLVRHPTQIYQYNIINNLKLYDQIRCAGHAKWQNIRSTKTANDVAKGRLVSRYVLLVRRAVISGGMNPNPKLNNKLGAVLTEASKFNVPKATLERAIERAMNVKMKPVTCEIQGPGGCSLVARCETDNISALRRELKKVCKKFDSSLVTDNTLLNMFKSQGFVRTEMKTKDDRQIDQDFAEEAAILSNAQEVSVETYETNEGNQTQAWVFSTDADSLNPCRGELEKQGFVVISHDLELVPYREVDFGPSVYEKVEGLVNSLRELDQVLDIFHNVSVPKLEEAAQA